MWRSGQTASAKNQRTAGSILLLSDIVLAKEAADEEVLNKMTKRGRRDLQYTGRKE